MSLGRPLGPADEQANAVVISDQAAALRATRQPWGAEDLERPAIHARARPFRTAPDAAGYLDPVAGYARRGRTGFRWPRTRGRRSARLRDGVAPRQAETAIGPLVPMPLAATGRRAEIRAQDYRVAPSLRLVTPLSPVFAAFVLVPSPAARTSSVMARELPPAGGRSPSGCRSGEPLADRPAAHDRGGADVASRRGRRPRADRGRPPRGDRDFLRHAAAVARGDPAHGTARDRSPRVPLRAGRGSGLDAGVRIDSGAPGVSPVARRRSRRARRRRTPRLPGARDAGRGPGRDLAAPRRPGAHAGAQRPDDPAHRHRIRHPRRAVGARPRRRSRR